MLLLHCKSGSHFPSHIMFIRGLGDPRVKSCTADWPRQLTLAHMGVCGHGSGKAPGFFCCCFFVLEFFFFLLKSAEEEPGLKASQPCLLRASLMLHASMQAVLQQKVLLAKVSKRRACICCPTSKADVRVCPSSQAPHKGTRDGTWGGEGKEDMWQLFKDFWATNKSCKCTTITEEIVWERSFRSAGLPALDYEV